MSHLEGSEPFTVSNEEVIAAVAYCRLGGEQPHPLAFMEALRRGLLAHDPTWRATDRGEGALIGAGLLKPEGPAPQQRLLFALWAYCDQYPEPQFVAAWTEYQQENWSRELSAEAVEDWHYRTDQGSEVDLQWRFFLAELNVDVPAIPAPSAFTFTCLRCGTEYPEGEAHASCNEEATYA